MNILDIPCNDIDLLDTMRLIRKVINLIYILGPLVIIITSGIDIIKAVTSRDEKAITKNVKRIPNRLIMCAMIFIIPSLVFFTIDLIDSSSAITSCFEGAKQENYDATVKEMALEAMEKAKGSMDKYDVAVAIKLVKKLPEGSLKDSYLTTMQDLDNSIKVGKKDSNQLPKKIATTTDELGEQIVEEAKKYVGLKYVSGGNSLSTGTDCSGFAKLIFAKFGITLKRVSNDQGLDENGTLINSLDDAKPGDLLFFYYPQPDDSPRKKYTYTHVAIFMGDHYMIEESSGVGKVRINDEVKNVKTIRRFIK